MQTHQKKVRALLKSAESFNASILLAKKAGELLWPVVRQNQGFARKNEIWRSPTSLTLLEQEKSWRTPKDLANTDFLANPYLANPSFSTIKNRGLAKPYILANPYSGELLRSL